MSSTNKPASKQHVRRSLGPAPYKPQPLAIAQPKIAATPPKAVALRDNRRPIAPPVFRAPSSSVQAKRPLQAWAHTAPPAPPVYRPLQPATAVQTKRAQTIQRMDQIRGFPGFYEGALPEENRGGTFNTVWSQTQPVEEGSNIMSHSSVKFSKSSKTHLVGFAQVSHIADEENTHAEDRLAVYVQQRAIEISYQTKSLPSVIEVPEFFVSASPCTSTFGTSTKSKGCTENLIEWATTGLRVESEMGCVTLVKVRIGKLVVNKLYKSNSYVGAIGSMSALRFLKRKGAIGSWQIENDPPLDVSRIDGYQKAG